MRELFQLGRFSLHSGMTSRYKIECDALSDREIVWCARHLAAIVSPFGKVEGVPRGGLRLASALGAYATEGWLLVVDDVLTTGASIEEHRAGRDAIGAVIFARGPCPPWVTPLFQMAPTPPRTREGEE